MFFRCLWWCIRTLSSIIVHTSARNKNKKQQQHGKLVQHNLWNKRGFAGWCWVKVSIRLNKNKFTRRFWLEDILDWCQGNAVSPIMNADLCSKSPLGLEKKKKKNKIFLIYENGLETLFHSSEPGCLFTCFTFENVPILWKPWHFHLCMSVKLQCAYLHVLYCLVCN